MKRTEAESTILAEMTLNIGASIETIMARIRAEHFSDSANRAKYEALVEQYSKHGRVSATEYHQHYGLYEEAIDVIVTEHKSDLVSRYCNRAIEHLISGADPDKVSRKLSVMLDGIATQGQGEPLPLRDHVTNLIEELKKPESQIAMVGLLDFDTRMGGFKAGQMVVVAARPGMGKSVFAAQVAVNNASKGIPVLLLSLEMSGTEIASRIVSGQLGISSTALQRRSLSEADWRVLERAPETIDIPLFIHDKADMDLTAIRSLIRKYRRTYGVGMVVVDYIGLISEPKESMENREQQVARMSRFFKTEAKEQDIPIMVLAQLNRELEKRATKMPQLADLRESGSIEQDADTVIFLHRPEQAGIDTMPDGSPSRGKIIINVAKRRSGTTGYIVANFNGDHQRIDNATTQHEPVASWNDGPF